MFSTRLFVSYNILIVLNQLLDYYCIAINNGPGIIILSLLSSYNHTVFLKDINNEINFRRKRVNERDIWGNFIYRNCHTYFSWNNRLYYDYVRNNHNLLGKCREHRMMPLIVREVDIKKMTNNFM